MWSLSKKFLVSPKKHHLSGNVVHQKKSLFEPPKKVAPRGDERCIEVVASGLPLYHSAQLAVDFTMRCVVSSRGEARPGAAAVALETGGRWSPEALALRVSHGARAREAPHNQARSAFLRGGGDGIGCYPSLAQKRSPLPCCSGAGR